MQAKNMLKVLLVVEQCNPDWPSVPLVGFRFFEALSQRAAVTLVTHERNRPALEQLDFQHHGSSAPTIVYIPESQRAKAYYRIVMSGLPGGMANWPLYHALTYPIYAEFNARVYQQFAAAVSRQTYDLVHAITPMMPRYPVKLSRACQKTPFILGPVNGGIPFPPNFQSIAAQEFAYLNLLRGVGRWLIPGYRQTYRQARQILVGSTYTGNWLQSSLGIPGDRLSLFFENGLTDDFLAKQPQSFEGGLLQLLFVGRLVPYKAADMVVEALGQLPEGERQRVALTLVGDGPQRSRLEQQVQSLGLEQQVAFTGWIPQEQTRAYYRRAHLFCFPSIREFGGAVVLEAMASGLPCIVADYGGIGEYVTSDCGFKIPPESRSHLVQGLVASIQTILTRPETYPDLSRKALQRAAQFRWSLKAAALLNLYQETLKSTAAASFPKA